MPDSRVPNYFSAWVKITYVLVLKLSKLFICFYVFFEYMLFCYNKNFRIRVSGYMSVYLYVCVCMYISIRIHICMYTYVYVYTHTYE